MPMPEPPPPPSCPRCGARCEPGALHCSLCHTTFSEPLATTEPPAVAPPPPRRGLHLGSMMLIIALIAVCLAVTQELPWLGVPLIVASLFAMARTIRVSNRRYRNARPLTTRAAVLVFLSSLALTSAAGWAAIIAFTVTCFPVGLVLVDTSMDGLGIGFAVMVGLVAAGFVLYLFWKIDLGDGPWE